MSQVRNVCRYGAALTLGLMVPALALGQTSRPIENYRDEGQRLDAEFRDLERRKDKLIAVVDRWIAKRAQIDADEKEWFKTEAKVKSSIAQFRGRRDDFAIAEVGRLAEDLTRLYAAKSSIERRKKDVANDDFFLKADAEQFKRDCAAYSARVDAYMARKRPTAMPNKGGHYTGR